MTDHLLLQIIKRAAREEATELDLSGNNLKVLPSEIDQLTNLSTLNISGDRTQFSLSIVGRMY